MERSKDWIDEVEGDLEHAKSDVAGGYYNWACFAAQQSAEKSVKGKLNEFGYEVRGHSIVELLETLDEEMKVPGEIKTAGRKLDIYYIPSRYPNAYPSGAPVDKFDEEMAEEAVRFAAEINAFARK